MKNMPDHGGTGLTSRQVVGSKYAERTKNLPKSIERYREEDGRRLSMSGISKNPPEVEQSRFGAYIVFFDLDTLLLELPQNNFAVNLRQFMPKGWTIKGIELTSPECMPPEVHEQFTKVFDINSDKQEIIIGNFADTEGQGVLFRIIKILLWNILCARFTADIGKQAAEIEKPENEEVARRMVEAVSERRQDLLDCLNAEEDGNAAGKRFKTLMETPFATAT